MKSQGVVGKRIVAIKQQRTKTEYGWVTELQYIELENGSRIIFHVTSGSCDDYVSGEVLTVKRQKEIRARVQANQAAAKPASKPKARAPRVAPLDKLNAEQLEAVMRYAEWCKRRGDNWKHELSLDWMRAGSSWDGPYHLLHQVRNQHGPSWLDTVQTRDLRERGANV